jgi:hypothetical protein
MFSAAIIHAPWSAERGELVASVRRRIPWIQVVSDHDHEGDLRIANRRGCWPMARRAWSCILPAASHHLVLEDDAVLCDRFPELAVAALEQKPRAALSLFHGARSCSVATILPAEVIPRWLAWAELESRTRPHHDQLLDLGLHALGVEHLRTSPSLVQHEPVASLLGHAHVMAERFDSGASSFTLEPR